MARLKFAIRNFAGAAGVFAAAFCLSTSVTSTLFAIGFTVIIAGIFSFGMRDDETGKRYGPGMLLYGGILVILGFVCLEYQKILVISYYVGAVALVLVGYFQWLKFKNEFGPTKLLRIIEGFAIFVFPVLITVGVILTVFTQKISLGRTLIIIGAVIWIIYNIYALILMDSDGEPDLSKFKFGARKSSYNFDRHKTLNQNDVISIVHNIAGRCGGGRGRDSLPHQAAVTIYVFEQVDGSHIHYTISGNLHGTIMMLNEHKIEVQAALQRKLQQKQQELINMTKRELSKYGQLPYSTYDIDVEIGYFDE